MKYEKRYLKCDNCKGLKKIIVFVEKTGFGKITEVRAKPCTLCGRKYYHSELIKKLLV